MGDRNSSLSTWETIAQTKRSRRDAAIPAEWRIRPGLIPDDQLNVTNAPAMCGILTTREISITEAEANILISKLISREYSSYEVCIVLRYKADERIYLLKDYAGHAGFLQTGGHRSATGKWKSTGLRRVRAYNPRSTVFPKSSSEGHCKQPNI